MTALLVALLFVAEPSTADRSAAEAHARAARELVAKGQYDAAEVELRAAYALDSSPFHLYGLGVLAKLRDDCKLALRYFERTLAALPDSELDAEARATTRTDTEQQIRECGGVVPPLAIDPPRAEPTTTDAPPEPVPAPRPSRPWHRDPAGGALLGTGLAASAVGIGLLAGARVVSDDAGRSSSATDLLAGNARARRLAIAGTVITSIGGALLIGAVVRYVVVHRRGRAVTDRNRGRTTAGNRAAPGRRHPR